uniref:Ribonucleoside-diphosphate reductase n=1 Tax=Chionoecetes opilio bacilliform virus TaxID=1825681 RepID=A0A1Q3DKZ4_9VIRU|nr:ribonucleotide reductase large subunit [Chionoecetes opilio bacilliform virus]GAV93144.1 ribonucleotide reductase large subunit [Chionoecetes opilio bacilliform virus]
MYIIKRNGDKQILSYDKILARLKAVCTNLDGEYVFPEKMADLIIKFVAENMTTDELDDMIAKMAVSRTTIHYDYETVSSRIAASNLQSRTKEWKKFSDVTDRLRDVLSKEYVSTVMRNAEILDAAIVHNRDFKHTFFGLKTLEYSYLLKNGTGIIERPQHMHMRVAVAIHGDKMDDVIDTYNLLSNHIITHASPTMFNAELASCFLLGLEGPNIQGIFSTLSDCAMISSNAGGIGVHMHNLHAKGKDSNGVVNYTSIFNSTARGVNQGANKRKGAIAIYLEVWHGDILDHINSRIPTGDPHMRTHDLFPALWIPDLFMKRVVSNGVWSLMCPSKCPGLSDVYGDEFERLYTHYEKEGEVVSVIRARELLELIAAATIATGTPFICFKDAVNRKNNQENLGVIKSSNLCTEIMEYSDEKNTAVCNLASVALNSFVKQSDIGLYYDFEALHSVVKKVTKNLNNVIDRNVYPAYETRDRVIGRDSNYSNRPIGIGVQGLADVFMMLGWTYYGDDAKLLNLKIFETIYHAALSASSELAKNTGRTYNTYEGSPVSRGKLQFDMWRDEGGETQKRLDLYMNNESIQDWKTLRAHIALHGVRNSLLIALMPTASTAQILGNTESFEAITSNCYTRNVLAGNFQVVNKYLMKDLIRLNLWTDGMSNKIIASGGSVATCTNIPQHIRDRYRTVWEISQTHMIDMSADRGVFVDQSQSLNLCLKQAKIGTVTSMIMYGWRKNLKTAVYYLRSTAPVQPNQFTVDRDMLINTNKEHLLLQQQQQCSKTEESCVMCSS